MSCWQPSDTSRALPVLTISGPTYLCPPRSLGLSRQVPGAVSKHHLQTDFIFWTNIQSILISPHFSETLPRLPPGPRRPGAAAPWLIATLSPAHWCLCRQFVIFFSNQLNDKSCFAPALRHTVSFLSTAQHTPVGPRLEEGQCNIIRSITVPSHLIVFMFPSIFVHSLPLGSSGLRPIRTNTSSALLTPHTAWCHDMSHYHHHHYHHHHVTWGPTAMLLILPSPGDQEDPWPTLPWPVPSLYRTCTQGCLMS